MSSSQLAFLCCTLAFALNCVYSTASSENITASTLRFEPTPPKINGTENLLIWYKATDSESYEPFVKQLSEFLAVYKVPGLTSGRRQNIYNCDYNQPPPKGQVCDVDIRHWVPCVEENHFSYHKSSPCVFLKIETPTGWIPEYYNNSKDLPENMPVELRNHISATEQYNKEKLSTIWLTCEGASPVDKELIGPVLYVPLRGFPGYYFQQDRPTDYLSPLVGLHFERPMRGVIIVVECKLWAKNIMHDIKTKTGLVQFELLVD